MGLWWPPLTAEHHCSDGVGFLYLPCHSHHEPVVHANLSKAGSNRADVLL